MAEYPSMPLFVDDFEAATTHLTLEEDGAYNRLLRLCWRTPGCSIPDDEAWIKRRMRVDEETFHRVVVPIIDEFFVRKNGRVWQKRQQKEFAYVTEVSEKRKQAGSKGGTAKALKRKHNTSSKTNDLPVAKRKQNASKTVAPTPTPTPTPNKPPNPPNRGTDLLSKSPGRDALVAVVGEGPTKAFIEHRRSLKKNPTDHALGLLAKKCREQFPSPESAIQAIDTAIERGWQTIYPPDPGNVRQIPTKAPANDPADAIQRRIAARRERGEL